MAQLIVKVEYPGTKKNIEGKQTTPKINAARGQASEDMVERVLNESTIVLGLGIKMLEMAKDVIKTEYKRANYAPIAIKTQTSAGNLGVLQEWDDCSS